MDAPERQPATGVEEDPAFDLLVQRMGFLSLVGLLERLSPQAVPVGHQGPPSSEAIRFRHDPSLGFSARDVVEVVVRRLPRDPFDVSSRQSFYEVTTGFLGLTGSAGPLPSYLAEEVAQEDPDRSTQRDFLDVFHHRLISLLYRELVRLQLWGEQTTDLRDRWACRLMALAGFDVFEQPAPGKVPISRLLRLTPLLAQGVRPAWALKIALEELLGDQLGASRIELHEFVGIWAEVENGSRTRLGMSNHQLGRTMLLGGHVFDRAGSLEIQIGPVSRSVYERFLPDGDLSSLLHEILHLFMRDPLDYRIILEIEKRETPRLRLVSKGGGRLGRDTWLGERAEKTRVTVYPYAREDRPLESIEAFSAQYYGSRPSRGVDHAR
jgi:type VI secretion system protein ImpH